MPCSSQTVETAPRGASSGHCEIARRTRGSTGSWAATAAASWWKCHHQDDQECHRCPDADSSPMSRDITCEDIIRHHYHRTNVREYKSPTKRSIGGYRSCSSSHRWLVCILLAFAGIG